jgi:diketogulonate reductase-like aldo/keto reductase
LLARIAGQRGISAYQVALAFLIEQGRAFAIPKGVRLEHVRENAAAGDLELDAAERRALDAAFPAKRRSRLATI